MAEVGQYQRRQSAQITGATAREIALSAEAAIRDRLLDSGDPLPTVRALAQSVCVSPATVNAAYKILRQRGLVVADGRRGTRVAPRPALRGPAPSRQPHAADPQSIRRDLTLGLPDPALLVPLAPALARVDLEAKLRISYLDASDPDLLALTATSFEADGIPARSITVVGGALDGIERVLAAHLRPGDRVVLEDPAYPPIRDILLALGLVPVPVPVDDLGLVPDALEAALNKGAQAAVAIPRAQNPFGSALDEQRASDLRGLLARWPDLLLVEDDHAVVVSGAPYVSLIAPSWPSWAVVRSTSKILHPDIRLALVAGDETTIARVEGRQALGPRWVSHILQALAAELLGDPGYAAAADQARDAYAARRAALVRALAEQGVEAHGRSGLNVWVRVREEAPVVRTLLDAGWLVLSGEHFRIATSPGIRITTAALRPEEADEVAALVASAERAGSPRRAY